MTPEFPIPDFKTARVALDLTIPTAARATRIKPHYLEWLEAGDLEKFPSATQAQGFARAYAEYLGINIATLPKLASEAEDSDEAGPKTPGSNANKTLTAAQVFSALGARLKVSRERLGLSMADAAEHTHIPEHYLQYMESGDFERFPSPVQARGMLGNYAAFLESDESELLLQFAEALQVQYLTRMNFNEPEKAPPKNKPRFLPLWIQRYFSTEIFVIAVLSSLLTAIFLWSLGQVLNTQAEQSPEATAPPLGQAVLPSATVELIPTQQIGETPAPDNLIITTEPEESTAEANPINAGQGSIQVFLIVRQRTYIRVAVDGVEKFNGRAIAGANLSFSGSEQIEVIIGNGSAVQVFYNQNDLGILGIFGEVISISFSDSQIITPTATQPTITETPVSTPSP